MHVAGAFEIAKPHLNAPIVAAGCVVKAVGISDVKHYECSGLISPELVVLPEELFGLGGIVHLHFDHSLPLGTPEIFVGDVHEVGAL